MKPTPTPEAVEGYTLIELAVVIAMLGVLLVFSLPRFRDALLVNDLKASSRRIVALVREVRNTACRSHQDYLLHIDISRGRLWSGQPEISAEAAAAAEKRALALPAKVRILDVWSSGQGKRALDEASIRFSRKGYTEQTMIHLEASNGEQASLLLAPFSGEIKLYDKYVEIEKSQ